MYAKKRKNILPAVIIILIGLIVVLGVLAYSHYITAADTVPFVRERRRQGERLYQETLARDLAASYPQTPQELMTLFNATTHFLYGSIIDDDVLFERVVLFQREMFSTELLEGNPFQEQLANLLEAIYLLNEYGITPRRPDVVSARYTDLRSAIVNVRQVMVHYDNLYWAYFLERDDDDFWRITGWVRTDSSFMHDFE